MMTTNEINNLAQRIGDYFHLFKDYTFLEFDNTQEDVARRVEQLKCDLTDVEMIDEIIFDVTDCNKNLDNSHESEAKSILSLLKQQKAFLEKTKDKRMVSDTGYEVKNAFRIGDKEILFAENSEAKDGMCYLVADYTENDLLGQYDECIVSDDFLEAVEEFSDRVSKQIVATRAAIAEIGLPHDLFTAEHCFPNDYKQSIDGKIVALKADIFRPEYRRGDVQLVLVNGGSGARANPNGRTVYCYHLNDGKHSRFYRTDVQGEVKPEFLPQWAKEKAAEIQAGKTIPTKKPKNKEAR